MTTAPPDGAGAAERGPFVLRHAFAQLLFWSGFYYLFPALMPRIAQSTDWSAMELAGG
ncbi:hypothetical protein [Oceanibium sediminis]|uniref:hypothetical protein n=1 Tax=Oceanibium sediminis TaxID=2026339 RepID=UPI00130088AF|nr:hypothetical protein [Oceanibium sediminis]